MDLGICPRCGEKWIRGWERCSYCPFVAIGAGLPRRASRKKPSRPYREPGSGTPLLIILAVALMTWLASSSAVANGMDHVVASLDHASAPIAPCGVSGSTNG